MQAALADAAAASGLDDARLFTQQGMFTRRILEAMGLEALDATISQMRAEGNEARRQQLENGRAQIFEEVSEFVERQIAMRTKNAGRLLREEALSRIRLGNLDKSDMKIMRELIRKLAKRLATRHARRRKKPIAACWMCAAPCAGICQMTACFLICIGSVPKSNARVLL